MTREKHDAATARLTRDELDRLGRRVRRLLFGRLHDFRIEPDDCGVVLHGRARTYYAKQLAQHAVMRATPVPIVRNEIEVS